jgi:NAD/NADP transhydrogenase beta subunit
MPILEAVHKNNVIMFKREIAAAYAVIKKRS